MANSKDSPKKGKIVSQAPSNRRPIFSPKLISIFADEVAKTLADRLPSVLKTHQKKSGKGTKKKIEDGIFLDTSAIIDGRIFDLINLGLICGTIVVPESILLELKHIADSQNSVKRERGRKGLELLERVKNVKNVKLVVLPEEKKNGQKREEVDEKLIKIVKANHGRVITCDYNLEKKASIEGVSVVNVNALANALKITAVPGESVHLKILHPGKDTGQGVGYLDDGTMVVVEQGSTDIEKTVDVVVSRVIQTPSGRILFAKKIM